MWLCGKEYKDDVDLKGKTAVVTGGNTGIGYETAKSLYEKGARVLILCRDEQKAKEAIQQIKCDVSNCSRNSNVIKYKHLDLGDLASVRKCAEEILKEEQKIHLLINNAGVMTHPEKRTKDDFEMHMGTNYLGPMLLTLLLLPRIIESGPARIVNVSSLAHKFPFVGGKLRMEDLNFKEGRYRQLRAYGQSKLAVVMFTKELAKKLKEAGVKDVTTYSLHPGVIATELGRNFNQITRGASWMWNRFKRALLKTPKQGAATTLYCALDDKVKDESGLYYSGRKHAAMDRLARDEELCTKLWEESMKLIDLQHDYIHCVTGCCKSSK